MDLRSVTCALQLQVLLRGATLRVVARTLVGSGQGGERPLAAMPAKEKIAE